MTVLSYYFANYTYDADVLMLASAALLAMTPSNRRWPAAAAGVAAALAVMAKPPYLAFVVLVPALALAMRALVRPERVHRALVGVHALVFRPRVYNNPAELDRAPEIPRVAKLAASLSLVLWIGLVVAGRWIG